MDRPPTNPRGQRPPAPHDALVDDVDEPVDAAGGAAAPSPDADSLLDDATAMLRLVEHITEMGAQDPESEAFLQEVASELARQTSSTRAILSLLEPTTGALDVKAAVGFGAELPPELSYVQDGIHGWVLKIGTPMALSNPDQNAGLPLLPFERCALLAAPLQVGSTRVGAVSVFRPSQGGGYAEQHMLLLTTVASLIGGMIGHARALALGQEAIRKAIESLTLALDARDPYTRGHSQRVAMYSLAIANELESAERYSFVKEMRNSLLMSALLHDIGKIGIRDEVLLKPGKLTDDEYGLIKTHPEKGAEIVRMIPGFDENVISGILQHHERFDGKGYPTGISGERIHLFGRIIGLADCFDAIVTSRPYSTGASFTYGMSRLEELSGTAFDPEIVRAMSRALKDQAVWKELGAISNAKLGSETSGDEAIGLNQADRTLRRVFGQHIGDLPTLPHVVSQVLEKTRNNDTNLEEVVNLIATDQALVSTYLRLVNSAFYGFSRRITTLKQAITLLGFRSVRNVVVNAGVAGVFRKRTFNNHYRHRLWDHSVCVAVAARTVAEKTGYKAKEEAFTAGLLHDIGKVVIDQYAPKDSATIMQMVEKGRDSRAAEEEVLGVDHTKIGSWIAERWHLPKTLCWVIEHHHEPLAEDAPGDKDLVRIVAVANTLSYLRKHEDDDAIQAQIEQFLASDANLFGFDSEKTRAILEATWSGKSEAMKTFGPDMHLRRKDPPAGGTPAPGAPASAKTS